MIVLRPAALVLIGAFEPPDPARQLDAAVVF
jgi:hypothetical protein